MKVKKKKMDDGRVLLEAVADPGEVDRALMIAQRQFGMQMNLHPGKDKTVAQAAEEQLGIKDLDSVVETQALDFLAPFAIDKSGIIPSYPPEPMGSSPLKRGQNYSFRLYVIPKPDYELTSYDPVDITVVPYELDQDLVNRQLDEMMENYAEYVRDDNATSAIDLGTHAKLTIQAKKDGEVIQGITTEGRTYTAGEGYMPEGFDKEVIGMKPGETKTFTFEGPSFDDDYNPITETIECTVTVLEIQKKVIPAITDEWVKKVMPWCRSAKDLIDQVTQQVDKMQRAQYDSYVRQVAVGELAERFQGNIPDAVYESTQKSLIAQLKGQLEQQNIPFDTYVEQNGGKDQFNMLSMVETRNTLRQSYSLDALFRHEGMVINDDDITEVCATINPRNPAGVRQDLEGSGRSYILRESAERIHANKWLVEHANITYKTVEEMQAEQQG